MGNPLQTGARFGRWSVLDECGTNEQGEPMRKCRCDCGTERFVLERSLKSGDSKSCGCTRKDSAASGDLTGQVFGDLTVLGKAENQNRSGGVWWQCRCSCGNLYEAPATLLRTGRRTRCSGSDHKKNYASADITGQRFHMLTALYPTPERDPKGNVVWHCRCDCGNEVDFSYNVLMYSRTKSCGCQKRQHEQHLGTYLDFVDGTSFNHLTSKTLPQNNTTGVRGVYLIRGKYVAKIVIQKKQYFLGTYATLEEAAAARLEAEEAVSETVVPYYEKWKACASADPEWSGEHPIRIIVRRDKDERLQILLEPSLTDETPA